MRIDYTKRQTGGNLGEVFVELEVVLRHAKQLGAGVHRKGGLYLSLYCVNTIIVSMGILLLQHASIVPWHWG